MTFLFIIFLFLLQTPSIFTQQLYEKQLYPFDGMDGDYFGRSIAVSDSFLFVSSIRYSNSIDASVYCYKFENNDYKFVSKIYPEDPEEETLFGAKILYKDGQLFIGARNKRTKNLPIGALYVFELSNGVWIQKQKVIPPEPYTIRGYFSTALVKNGDYLLVGSYRMHTNSEDAGKVFLYKNINGRYEYEREFWPKDSRDYQFFGQSLLMTDNLIFIGASNDSTEKGYQSGSLYVYEKTDTSWQLHEKYLPEINSTELRYGTDLAMSNNYIFVGTAVGQCYQPQYGKVYIYNYSGPSLTLEQIIESGNSFNGDLFGYSLFANGDSVFVSEMVDNIHGELTGSVYLFVNEGGNWNRKIRIMPSPSFYSTSFGGCTIFSEEKLFIGAYTTKYNGMSTGTVYIYTEEPLTELKENVTTPSEFYLSQNYPNPFNPMTNISFYIPNSDLVRITIHNSVGEEIIELENGIKQSGFHTVTFNGKSLASGVYIYSLKVGENSETKKMVLMK